MKKLLSIGGSLCAFLLFLPTFANGEEIDTEPQEKRHGLVTGLLDEIGKTVEGTASSLGGVVETAAGSVDKTVRDTVDFTANTVESVVKPSEKPVTTILENTGEFVETTVNNVVPVVDSTTSTAKTAVRGINGTVDQLPDVPVVKPAVQQVGKTVENTVASTEPIISSTIDAVNQTVQDTVTFTTSTVEELANPTKPVTNIVTNTGDLLESTVSNVAPVVENTVDTLHTVAGALPIEKSTVTEDVDMMEQTTMTVTETMPETKPNTTENGQQVSKQVGPQVELTTAVPDTGKVPDFSASNESVEEMANQNTREPLLMELNEEVEHDSGKRLGELAGASSAILTDDVNFSHVEQSEDSEGQTQDGRADNATEEVPLLQLGADAAWFAPALLTTGTTSIVSPTFTAHGFSDIVPGVLVGFLVQDGVYWRQWMLSDANMRTQWTHAPPGQPPRFSPFLLKNK